MSNILDSFFGKRTLISRDDDITKAEHDDYLTINDIARRCNTTTDTVLDAICEALDCERSEAIGMQVPRQDAATVMLVVGYKKAQNANVVQEYRGGFAVNPATKAREYTVPTLPKPQRKPADIGKHTATDTSADHGGWVSSNTRADIYGTPTPGYVAPHERGQSGSGVIPLVIMMCLMLGLAQIFLG